MAAKKRALKAVAIPTEIIINLGEVDCDLKKKWPWKDNSVDELTAINLLQTLWPVDRIHFVNEIGRVLKPDGKCQIQVPHWASNRAYADIDVAWPPVSEGWLFFLSKAWREANVPKETRYTCDLACTWGYGLHPNIATRNQEYQQHAVTFWKEAAQDLCATLIKS